jgi:NDMA-dependent alcohol dehydrogenase
MKTKGALLWDIGGPWVVEDVEIGEPKAGEVMVELAASGLCHSDEHLLTGSTPIELPAIGGHEGAGVVIKVGSGVTHVREGDHVVTAFIPACGVCPPCSSGHQNLCDLGAQLITGESISDRSFRVRARGRDVRQMCLLGTFSPYITVNQASVVKIERDIPLDVAALVGCGVTTGWGSATRVGDVRPGDTVVVMGVGGVGMSAVQGAAAAGARRVIVIDPASNKHGWAVMLGATDCFGSYEEAMDSVSEITYGRMADEVIIAVGQIKGEHVQQALTLTAKGGCSVVVAMGDSSDLNVTLSLFELALLQKDLRGTIFGGGNPRVDIPRMLSLYKSGHLQLDAMVTKRYRLEEVNDGYRDMRNGRNIRGLITYGSEDR